jgi:hypothetical protein
MKIKTTVRYNLTPVRRATMKKRKDKVGKYVGKRQFVYKLLVGM